MQRYRLFVMRATWKTASWCYSQAITLHQLFHWCLMSTLGLILSHKPLIKALKNMKVVN